MGRIILEDRVIVTEDDFTSTYKYPKHYKAVESREFLKSKVLLPLTFHSPLLLDLNRVLAAVIWSGYVSWSEEGAPAAGMDLKPELKESLQPSLDALEVKLLHSDWNCYTLGENGRPISRLLARIPGLAVSRGTLENRDDKSKMLVTIPDYLRLVTNGYFNIYHEDKDIARSLIADHLNIMMQAKLTKGGSGPLFLQLQLIGNYEENLVQQQGEAVLKMFTMIYPKMGLTPKDIKVYPKVGIPGYRGHIQFTRDTTINAIINYNLFDLEMRREPHPLGARTTSLS